jgi:hypothetical protein
MSNQQHPRFVHPKQDPRLGIDIGRVIIAPGDTHGDTSFLNGTDEQAMRTPPNKDSFEAIAQLVKHFNGKVWLVSKAGQKVSIRTRQWLREWDFYKKTGVPVENLYFCKERADKRGICERLRVTHFIDDRLDVLSHMRGLVSSLYLFGPQPQRPKIDWVQPVLSWRVVLDKFALGLPMVEEESAHKPDHRSLGGV